MKSAELDWLILYYVHADENLESPLLDDVRELGDVADKDANAVAYILVDRAPGREFLAAC